MEHILVIPAEVLRGIGEFAGFTADAERYLSEIRNHDSLEFKPRDAMEVDPSFKQLIPYVVMRHVDASGVTSLFTYTRGGGGGEARLHAKRSVGVGGHISAEDASDPDTDDDAYTRGMKRELAEEVQIGGEYRERIAGLIYDDSTEVGQVHLGVVHIFDLDAPSVRSNEDDLAHGGFQTVESLRNQFDQLEVWSQLVLDHCFGQEP